MPKTLKIHYNKKKKPGETDLRNYFRPLTLKCIFSHCYVYRLTQFACSDPK